MYMYIYMYMYTMLPYFLRLGFLYVRSRALRTGDRGEPEAHMRGSVDLAHIRLFGSVLVEDYQDIGASG